MCGEKIKDMEIEIDDNMVKQLEIKD